MNTLALSQPANLPHVQYYPILVPSWPQCWRRPLPPLFSLAFLSYICLCCPYLLSPGSVFTIVFIELPFVLPLPMYTHFRFNTAIVHLITVLFFFFLRGFIPQASVHREKIGVMKMFDSHPYSVRQCFVYCHERFTYPSLVYLCETRSVLCNVV